MNMKRAFVLLYAIVVLLVVAGCSLPGKPDSRAKQSYLLQAATGSPHVDSVAARPCLSLRVSTPASAPGFDTRNMVYVTEPPRLDYFAYNQWVDTPARMLAAAMEAGLDASGVVGSVVSGSSDLRTDYRLDAELLKLQQDFSGNSSSVALQVKLKLIRVSDRSLLDSKTFSYTETADAATPRAGVEAANRAVDRFVADLVGFTAGALAPVSCPAPGS
jgi:cholesterol transport system auxiliary component